MDIWRCGFVAQQVDVLLDDWPSEAMVHWLPEQPPGEFLADPFGWQDAAGLHIFVERYDYRTRHGTIDRFSYDSHGRLLEARPVLREDWHLSYPQIFEAEGAIWMLPEASRSGTLMLYRGNAELTRWAPEIEIKLDRIPIDATPLWHDERWWLFYSVAGSRASANGHLHVAWAERLGGPWHPHPLNPVRVDRAGARPGGRAVKINGRIMLPVQDCSITYGGAVKPLWIDRLDEDAFAATLGHSLRLPPAAGRYGGGMHTLSGCGAWTFFDVKYVDRTGRGWWYGFQRWLRPFG